MLRIASLSLAALLTCGTIASAPAEAKGCLKGAAVGGLAGHMAGHGVLGAAGGCAVGHHMAHRNDDRTYNNDRTDASPGTGYHANNHY